MATNFLTFHPAAGIRACASSGDRKPDHNRRKTTSSAASSNWWAPVFGWSSEADYITEGNSRSDPEPKTTKTRISTGGFTEEKARQLRMMTKEMESFHDVMYHSAIASRLASDFKNRSDS